MAVTNLFSLVCTFLDRETYLQQAIDSVLAQSYSNWQLILWDDGSTDRSSNIAIEADRQDSRILYYDTSENKGRGKALFEAIGVSGGEFIGILDADDMLTPDCLNETVSAFRKNPRLGWFYSKYTNIDADGGIIGEGKKTRAFNVLKQLRVLCTFHFKAFRASYLKEDFLDKNLETAVDHDLSLRLAESGNPIYLPKVLYYYRKHPDRISEKRPKKQFETFVQCSQASINRRLWQDKVFLSYDTQARAIQVDRKKYIRPAFAEKVFILSLGRTGTRSVGKALKILGYNHIHNPKNLEVIEHFDSASDVLIAINYQQLDVTYPNSKFILTLRDEESWASSWQDHDERLRGKIGEFSLSRKLPKWAKVTRRQLYGQPKYDRQIWADKYNSHKAEVEAYFRDRPESLLLLNIFEDDSWKLLGEFLNVEVPKRPFPAVKDKYKSRDGKDTYIIKAGFAKKVS